MKRLVRWTAVCMVLLAATAALAGFWFHSRLHSPFAGWEGAATDVVLDEGLAAGVMLERLGEAGVLRDPRIPRIWLAWRGGAERLQAGEYRFERPANVVEVLDRLWRGDVLLHPVTFPEGLHLDEVAARLERAGLGDASGFRELFEDASRIADLDPAATDLEGYLFPDTYHFPRDERPEEIVSKMVSRFREVVGADYAERAERVGLDVREAVTLASMIEEETSVPGERPRISRVFHNRIRRGMKMECDPTVLYAHHRAGNVVERLTYADLRFESPWNTYRVAGLPVGPIANPGRASLEAAVQPAEGRELYFVAAPGGGHRFSETFAAHNRAVAEWRRYSRSSK